MNRDTDCSICFESHVTVDCPERKPQNCPSCHLLIKRLSDHSAVCGTKQWFFRPYEELYATSPLDRAIIGCNSPIRYLSEGTWRKPFDGEELYSLETGVLVRFKSVNDFCLLTRAFAPIRIAVVVRENSNFVAKLMLLSSVNRFIVAADVNFPFDRNTANAQYLWKTTLIVAMASADDLRLSVVAIPPRKPARRYELIFNRSTGKFNIPQELVFPSSPEIMMPEVYLKKKLSLKLY